MDNQCGDKFELSSEQSVKMGSSTLDSSIDSTISDTISNEIDMVGEPTQKEWTFDLSPVEDPCQIKFTYKQPWTGGQTASTCSFTYSSGPATQLMSNQDGGDKMLTSPPPPTPSPATNNTTPVSSATGLVGSVVATLSMIMANQL